MMRFRFSTEESVTGKASFDSAARNDTMLFLYPCRIINLVCAIFFFFVVDALWLRFSGSFAWRKLMLPQKGPWRAGALELWGVCGSCYGQWRGLFRPDGSAARQSFH
ncbi:hypothetical protein TcCL_NonESM05899 [Trypanosoma cruzi]|nr:hypothetical protein TcCL_NonESM05899 [Trypanosoma cruzi]